MKTPALLPILLAAAGLSSGCFWLVAGGAGAEAGYVASQDDRSTGDTVSDQWIHAKIKAELLASSVASRKLDIKVRKGKVTLTGVLSSADEKSRALAIARGVKGVRSVKDKIYVSP